ncbi:isochorismate synthase [Granulicoccus sp. GXG6511]|uniref:isochorismate synthase n=1 Tax=Granulicoccus sp. GXG6511 TaxID=3381351 RepID=UPI003D7C79CA
MTVDTSGPVRARTVAIDNPGELVALLPRRQGLAWLRRGEGLVAGGEVVRQEFDSIAEADAWWEEYAAAVTADNALPGVFGTGPLAFGSFTFDPGNTRQRSVLVVPEWILGRRGGQHWLTRVGVSDRAGDDVVTRVPAPESEPARPGQVSYADGSMSGPAWESVVDDAVRRIKAGDLAKVVLARDLLARTPEDIDYRWLVAQLVAAYRLCWTYHVDGLVGASPEMLVRRENGLVTSRVLAGTIQRTADEESDRALAAHLSRSSKDLGEHDYAVQSVADALAPLCSGMNVPDAPYVLELPNVFHLATDVAAAAKPNVSSLTLATALHPSAAVCGTPTDSARELIRELEGLDRGRYSGPVGWVDAQGDGEWAIALRCGRIEGNTAQLYAGCGVVADSNPEAELMESMAKLVPMRDALEAG